MQSHINDKFKINPERIINAEYLNLDKILCSICRNLNFSGKYCGKCDRNICISCVENDLCFYCHDKLDNTNATGSKFLSEITVSCKYLTKGCKETTSLTYILEHEKICEFRNVHCNNCNNNYTVGESFNHLSDCFRISENESNFNKTKKLISIVKNFDEKIQDINYANIYGVNSLRRQIEKSINNLNDKIRTLEMFSSEQAEMVKKAGLERYKLNSPFMIFGNNFKECQIYFYCKGGYNGCARTGNVWGSNPYTSDSVICLAALHSGHITKEGGLFIIKKGGPLDSYYGSVKNGLSTQSYGSFDHMLILPSELDVKINFSNNVCGPKIGICKGRNSNCVEKGDVWGDNPYVKESNYCKAALHSGIITDNGGIFMIEETGTHGGYSGIFRNGISTLPCSSNRSSITIKQFVPY